MRLDDEDGKDGLLDRRTYMKAAGATALAAVAANSASAATNGNTIVIDADGTVSYSFEATGDVTRVQTPASVTDKIEGGAVTGEVTDGQAAYEVTGDMTAVNVEGTANVNYGPDADKHLPDLQNKLVVSSPSEIRYEFTTTGKMQKVKDGSKLAAEGANDSVTQNKDGTWTTTGYTGNGYGDSFMFAGDVVDFSPKVGEFTIELNGQETDPYTLTGTEPKNHELVITSPSSVNYEFTTTAGIEMDNDNGKLSAEDVNDSVTQNKDGTWTTTGYTGNGYGDTYTIYGDVTDFSPMTGDFSVILDGEPISTYELTGTEPPSQQSALIGGGDGYERTVDPSEATVTVASKSEFENAIGSASSGDVINIDTSEVTVTVASKSEFENAIGSASSGDVIYIDPSAKIDLGRNEYTVPAGVTLASNRGIDGAPGGMLGSTAENWPLFDVRDDVRVTGLRLFGPHNSYVENDGGDVGIGLEIHGSNVEVDNVEAFGFSYAAIRARENAHVHHCHIHHNPMQGLGYGIACASGHPVIEYNYMNYNRHSVASSGEGGYTVAYNHFGPETVDHVIDVHRPGGRTIEIHHNTVEATGHVQDNGDTESVAIRGVPDDVATINNNWFYDEEPPKATPDGWGGSAITQVHTSDWQSVEFTNNHYGPDEPSKDIGHPR